uniref:Cornichon family AMPA receptor auxiliary protein 4 n=1 Tax=Ursus maritimus TaxID=29073 RepID=A0A452UM82_URSMA
CVSVACAFSMTSCCIIITLSDLECDYINARSCCSKLNKWVIPELIGHTIVTVLMLVSLHWFIFLLNLPVATWNIYRFIMVPSGNMGVFDPTEIHNRGQLKSHMKEAMIKLGFHLPRGSPRMRCPLLAVRRHWPVGLSVGDAELWGILRNSGGYVHFVCVVESELLLGSEAVRVLSLSSPVSRPHCWS